MDDVAKTSSTATTLDDEEQSGRASREPQMHRTVDRVTQILEEVVYHPGMTFAELARALGAPKSSVYGFIQGLLAKGWLYEDDHRFYLGPAVYGLTIASGHIRAGMVTQENLTALHEATGVAVFLGVQAGDHLIYIGEAGGDAISGIEARSNIRRTLLGTAGGQALLATWPEVELRAFLRRRSPDEGGAGRTVSCPIRADQADTDRHQPPTRRHAVRSRHDRPRQVRCGGSVDYAGRAHPGLAAARQEAWRHAPAPC